jgi:uncharacterized protein YvpB
VQTLRFATSNVAARYPFPTSGPAVWSRCEGGWSTTVSLADLPNDHIVVPSYAQLAAPRTDFSVELTASGAGWRLNPTARTVPDTEHVSQDPRVSTHIDYFHARADLVAPSLTIAVAAPAVPESYLLTISSRPFRAEVAAGVRTSRRLTVPAISQLTAPRALRWRICSPTSVAMVLAYHGIDASVADATRDCFHASGLFGVWPLAVRTLADAGLIAAVECFSDLDTAAGLLERGLPIVASVRFENGALPGAALESTDGHLVVLTGLDLEYAYINDPAAKDASVVPRQCPREAFARAWLRERGAAYVACPL